MERTMPALTARERFSLAAQQEMAKFERQEAALRRSDRIDRARQLNIPMSIYDLTSH
jgi:hypothetical protein